MFYSKKFNFLFIANPKTGTVTVHDVLSKIDPNGERHKLTCKDAKVDSSDTTSGIMGHAKAKEIKNALISKVPHGEKIWNDLRKFVFVRNPRGKIVSAYHFNRAGTLHQAFKTKGKKRRIYRGLKTFFTVLTAKILPFSIYMVIYPMKSNKEYCTNEKGKVIVDFIGRTEHLQQDLEIILKDFIDDFDQELIDVPHLNKSQHKKVDQYFNNPLIKWIFDVRFSSEVKFYERVDQEMSAWHQVT